MRHRLASKIFLLAVGMALSAVGAGVWAADVQVKPALERELIPGAENMTPAERDAYRKRMEAAASAEEKLKIRAEYANVSKEPPRPAAIAGDAKRGASLHRACFYCHGVERYVAPVTYAAATFIDSVLRASGLSDLPVKEPTRFKGSAKSIADLRAGVNRRNDYLNPKMNAQEVEDVVAYLNETYYRFTE